MFWFARMVHALVLLVALWMTRPVGAEDLTLEVPPGFEASLFSDDSLAHDIYSMTIDPRGRVVVSGAGYIKTLHDDDGDGRADRTTLFSDRPASGAQGLLFVGNDLLCTGDAGVLRFADPDGDGVADAAPEVLASLGINEHGAHGIVEGPDGWFYLMCGNNADVTDKQATGAGSPVKHPRAGTLQRFSPDGQQWEVVAHGFRNAYDHDFNAAGQSFTVDSDNERACHLPWYTPTRLFDVQTGMHHGWMSFGWSRDWSWPGSFFDCVERLAEPGRGSPTGVACYRHRQFPEHYRGGVFSACWTLGRVYYFPLEEHASSYRTGTEIFLQTKGSAAFSPNDLAVAPNGDLFVSVGGRRTQGAVYCVRYRGTNDAPAAPPAVQPSELLQVLLADQPLDAWSRALWQPLADKLGREPFERAVFDEQLSTAARVRAVEGLVDRFAGLGGKLVEQAWPADPAVRARCVWGLARKPAKPNVMDRIVAMTRSSDPREQRVAWEALLSLGPQIFANPTPDWRSAATSSDRRVRALATIGARGAWADSYRTFWEGESRGSAAKTDVALRLQRLQSAVDGDLPSPHPFGPAEFIPLALGAWADTQNTTEQIETVRLLMLALGDVGDPDVREAFNVYVGKKVDQAPAELRGAIVAALAPRFPTGDAELDRQLSRLLAVLSADVPGLLDAVSRQWTGASTSVDDLHYLIVAALLPGPRSAEVTSHTATTLLALETKLRSTGEHPSQQWPRRVTEVYDALASRDPALVDRLIDDPEFGRPEHTLFAAALEGAQRERAARRLLVGAAEEPTSEWIAVVADLPAAESRPALEHAWEGFGVRDAIVLALARHPEAEDRAKFVEALASVQDRVTVQAACALGAFNAQATGAEVGVAVKALRQACQTPEQLPVRAALVKLLQHWNGQAPKQDPAAASDLQAFWAEWQTWFAAAYPDQGRALAEGNSADWAAWQTRLARIDWAPGDGQLGRTLFERKACHRCHQVSGQVGPDLRGVVSRSARDDLFAAIVEPSREISPAFQTVRVVTAAGQVHTGIVVYESPESTFLQTGPDTTLRLVGVEPSQMQPVRLSLMPSGLLDDFSDRDLADLYAYLKTLGNR